MVSFGIDKNRFQYFLCRQYSCRVLLGNKELHLRAQLKEKEQLSEREANLRRVG